MKKIKINISKRLADHLIQALLIFLSVFVAFWLNDYRHAQIEEEKSKLALEFVRTEMQNNLRILEDWTPYHAELVARTQNIIDKQKDTLIFFDLAKITDSEKGIFRSILTRDASKFIDGDTKMDQKVALLIVGTYEQQLYVENALKDVLDFLKEREIYDNEMAKTNYLAFHELISELHSQDMAMIEGYKYGIKGISSHLEE